MWIMTVEKWKDVIGYEGLYQISNMGQIKSFHRRWRKYSSKILNPSLKNGYPFMCLFKNNKKNPCYIHRLILETFHGPCPMGQECLHKDGNRQNNILDNLEWGTRLQNILDSINHGTWRHPPILCGIKHGRAKLTNQDVSRIRQIYTTGKLTQVQLAKQFNVTHYTISDIVNRRTWKHI